MDPPAGPRTTQPEPPPPRVRHRWIGPVLGAYWLLIFSATHLPTSALPATSLGDKTEHFIAYGMLGFLLYAWLRVTGRPWTRRRAALLALGLCMAYGAADELTQPIVGRVCDLRDFLADSVGAGLGTLVGMLLLAGGKSLSSGAKGRP